MLRNLEVPCLPSCEPGTDILAHSHTILLLSMSFSGTSMSSFL